MQAPNQILQRSPDVFPCSYKLTYVDAFDLLLRLRSLNSSTIGVQRTSRLPFLGEFNRGTHALTVSSQGAPAALNPDRSLQLSRKIILVLLAQLGRGSEKCPFLSGKITENVTVKVTIFVAS